MLLSVTSHGGLSVSGAWAGLLGKRLRELQGPGVSGFPANAINSRHPNPASLVSEYSTSRTLATLVYIHPIPRSERGVSLHCHGDQRLPVQQRALCRQRGPMPSLLWLTQACEFPFLQQSLFLNSYHGILSLIMVHQVVPHRDSSGMRCPKVVVSKLWLGSRGLLLC